jgi:hypothetical protein
MNSEHFASVKALRPNRFGIFPHIGRKSTGMVKGQTVGYPVD